MQRNKKELHPLHVSEPFKKCSPRARQRELNLWPASLPAHAIASRLPIDIIWSRSERALEKELARCCVSEWLALITERLAVIMAGSPFVVPLAAGAASVGHVTWRHRRDVADVAEWSSRPPFSPSVPWWAAFSRFLRVFRGGGDVLDVVSVSECVSLRRGEVDGAVWGCESGEIAWNECWGMLGLVWMFVYVIAMPVRSRARIGPGSPRRG